MKVKQFGSLSDHAISEMEKQYQVVLPEVYRSFLRENNGGIVSKDPPFSLQIPGTDDSVDLDILFGIGLEEVFSIDYWMGRYRDEIPAGSLIIGDDTTKGFLILLNVNGETRLCYWDDKRNLAASSDESNAYVLDVDCDSLFGEDETEAEKMAEPLLPLGSIVLLEGGAQKLLIIARGLNVVNAGRTFFFDYGAVPYPDGVQGDQMAYFQRESISKIVFEGYRDVDDENLTEAIERYIRENPDLLRGDPKNWSAPEQA